MTTQHQQVDPQQILYTYRQTLVHNQSAFASRQDYAGGQAAQRELVRYFTAPEYRPYLDLLPPTQLRALLVEVYEFLITSSLELLADSLTLPEYFAAQFAFTPAELKQAASRLTPQLTSPAPSLGATEAAAMLTLTPDHYRALTGLLSMIAPALTGSSSNSNSNEVERVVKDGLNTEAGANSSRVLTNANPNRWTRSAVMALVTEQVTPDPSPDLLENEAINSSAQVQQSTNSRSRSRPRPGQATSLADDPFAAQLIRLLGRYGPMTIYQLRALVIASNTAETRRLGGLRSRLHQSLTLAQRQKMVTTLKKSMPRWGAGRPAQLWLLERPGEIWYEMLTSSDSAAGTSAGAGDLYLAQHTFGIQQTLYALRSLINFNNRLSTLARLVEWLKFYHPDVINPLLSGEIGGINNSGALLPVNSSSSWPIPTSQESNANNEGEGVDRAATLLSKDGVVTDPKSNQGEHEGEDGAAATSSSLPALPRPDRSGLPLRSPSLLPLLAALEHGEGDRTEAKMSHSQSEAILAATAPTGTTLKFHLQMQQWATSLTLSRGGGSGSGATKLIPDAIGRLVVDSHLVEPTLLAWSNLDPQLEINQFWRPGGSADQLVWPFFLEYDRHTEQPGVFAQEKYSRYAELYNSIEEVAWRREWGSKFPVVLVVTEGDAGDLYNLKQAVIEQVRTHNHLKAFPFWWFTTTSWFEAAYSPYLDEQQLEAWESELFPERLRRSQRAYEKEHEREQEQKQKSQSRPRPTKQTQPRLGSDPRIWVPLGLSAEPYQLAAVDSYFKAALWEQALRTDKADQGQRNHAAGKGGGSGSVGSEKGLPALLKGMSALPLPHPLNVQPS